MRHFKVGALSDIPAATLTAFMQEAVALNRKHGDPTKRKKGPK